MCLGFCPNCNLEAIFQPLPLKKEWPNTEKWGKPPSGDITEKLFNNHEQSQVGCHGSCHRTSCEYCSFDCRHLVFTLSLCIHINEPCLWVEMLEKTDGFNTDSWKRLGWHSIGWGLEQELCKLTVLAWLVTSSEYKVALLHSFLPYAERKPESAQCYLVIQARFPFCF